MISNRRFTPVVLSVIVLVMIALSLPASAQVAISKSIYVVNACNRDPNMREADGFHIVLSGVHLTDFDLFGYYDDGFYQSNQWEDTNGVHLDWTLGSVPYLDYATLGFTVDCAAQFTSCRMYFTKGSVTIWQIDDVWQDTSLVSGSVVDTVRNRAASRRYIQRAAGLVSSPVDIDYLVGNSSLPPGSITIDSSPIPIYTTIPLSYNFTSYPGYPSYLMYYNVYDGSLPVPGNLLASFRNAAVVSVPASLSLSENVVIPDHFWWPGNPNPYSEMISLKATAGLGDDVLWQSVTLSASGFGNDSVDISSVSAWLDNNNDGKVDAGDSMIGLDAYPTDDGYLMLYFTDPPTVTAGSSVNVLIAYSMSGAGTPGSDYETSVIDAYASGVRFGGDAQIGGLPIDSAKLILASQPITIAAAKLKDPNTGSFSFLHDKVVIGYFSAADSSGVDILYLEEDDRSSGIGILLFPQGSPIAKVGDRISVNGIVDGSGPEALMFADSWVLNPDSATPPQPIGITGRASGGGAFGAQRAVVSDATSIPVITASGVNTVGRLIKIYGTVSGSGQLNFDGTIRSVFWVDDGSNLHDGFTTSTGDLSQGVAVLLPIGATIPANGTCLSVTGILSAQSSPAPCVRLLLPRDAQDIKQFPAN